MSAYQLILFLHVAAAMLLVAGSVVASPAVRAAARRAATVGELRASLAIGRPLSVLNPMAALTVLATGIHLATTLHAWRFGWIVVAAGAWAVNTVVAGAVVKPTLARLAGAAADPASGSNGDPIGERADTLRRSARWTVGGDVLLANDAAMVFLMTVRPDLPGSLLVLALAHGAVLTVRHALARRKERLRPALHA